MNAPAQAAAAPKPAAPRRKPSQVVIMLSLTYPVKEKMTLEELKIEADKAIKILEQAKTTAPGCHASGAVIIGTKKYEIASKG